MSRLRHLALGLVLLAAACGGGGDGSALYSPDDVEITGQLLSYDLVPGQRIAYDIGMSLDMNVDMRGGGTSGNVEMGFDLDGLAKFAVGAGSQPGTVAVTMVGEIEDIDVRKLTVDGQSMAGAVDDTLALSELGGDALIPEMTVLLDGQGKVLSVNMGGEDLTGLLGGGENMLYGLGPSGNTFGLESFFGPAFPTEKLTVGSQWTTRESVPVPPFGEMVIEATYLVTGREDLGDGKVFVIKSDVKTEAMTIDLARAFDEIAKVSAAEMESYGVDPAELDAMMSELGGGFSGDMVIAPMHITGTTWFDPAAGYVVKSDAVGILDATMSLSMAGLGSVDMDMGATVTYDLAMIGEPVMAAGFEPDGTQAAGSGSG